MFTNLGEPWTTGGKVKEVVYMDSSRMIRHFFFPSVFSLYLNLDAYSQYNFTREHRTFWPSLDHCQFHFSSFTELCKLSTRKICDSFIIKIKQLYKQNFQLIAMYKECIVILWNELEMRLGYEEALARYLG